MPGRRPPYGRDIAGYRPDEIIIATGGLAWRKIKRDEGHWQPRVAKLVLPYGDDPALYRWPVAGRIVQVWTCGEPEPFGRLVELAKCLLQCGAIKVLLLDTKKPMIVVRPAGKEAR